MTVTASPWHFPSLFWTDLSTSPWILDEFVNILKRLWIAPFELLLWVNRISFVMLPIDELHRKASIGVPSSIIFRVFMLQRGCGRCG